MIKIMASFSVVVRVAVLLFLVIGNVDSQGSISRYCNGLPVTPPARPDPKNEAVLYNEEVLTGQSCFSLEVRIHRRRNSMHLTLLRHDKFGICKKLKVKSMEFLAVAHNAGLRGRAPFGFFYRELNLAILKNEVCDVSGNNFTGSVDDVHVIFNSATTSKWNDCIRTDGGFFQGSDPSMSLRLLENTYFGASGSRDEKVIACAIWSYIGKNYTYPNTVTKRISIDFIAEMWIKGPSGEDAYRQVSKLAKDDVTIQKLPDLECKEVIPQPTLPPITCAPTTTSTTTPSTTSTSTSTTPSTTSALSSSSTTPSTTSTFSSTSTTIPSTTSTSTSTTIDPCHISTTPPPPIIIDVPCKPHATCADAALWITAKPDHEIYSPTYITVSDACKCREVDMKTGYTLRKYPYGGLHFGLKPTMSAPMANVIPYVPVKDDLFGDCLKFYFDTSTACAVFMLEQCAAGSITHLELHEFFIFALGSTTNVTPIGLPFGTWEPVDDSLGNCGHLVNNKAVKPMNQLWSSKYGGENSRCNPNPKNVDNVDMGMPDYVYPHLWRMTLDKPLVLQSTKSPAGLVKDSVYAVRLNTLDFRTAQRPKVPKFVNFVLEAYTSIETVDRPSAKYQIISLKTPIVEAHFPTATGMSRLDITNKLSSTHVRPYFQLDAVWHSGLHSLGKTCDSRYTVGPPPPKPPPPGDTGVENTCRCFHPLRHTGRKPNLPVTETEFVKLVPSSSRMPITEKCIDFGFVHNIPGSNPTPGAACTGNEDGQRILVYFGLTCTGPDGLEVMDMVVQAQNHRGYPTGFWKRASLAEQGNECKSTLSRVSGTPGASWQIRELIPLNTYKCPPVKTRANNEAFLHDEPPFMLFFNNNLTQDAPDTSRNFGFCDWWIYKNHKTHYSKDDRNFYFDFQFVATAYIQHRPSNTQYLVTFRSDRAGFNVRTCESEPLTRNLSSWDIHLNKGYYDKSISERYTTCLLPLSRIDTFATGLCGCFIGTYNILGHKFVTHRFNASDYPDPKHKLSKLAAVVRSCISITPVLDYYSTPHPYTVVVSFQVEKNADCQEFMLYELVLQTLNNHGLPMGTWKPTLLSGGRLCENANVRGEADLAPFKCPYSSAHDSYYKTDTDKINVLHFKNRWMDEGYEELCATWEYPEAYAKAHKPADLPVDFQFYAQTNFLHKPSNTMITGPTFSQKKIKFEQNGIFKDEIEIKPFQHIRDFNNYLFPGFEKDPVCFKLYSPKPPLYESYSCTMFHTDTGRIDLNDLSHDNPRAIDYKKRGCYEFDAYPGNEPLTMHLRFRQKLGNHDTCPFVTHFSLTAYNERGFPIGKTGKDTFVPYDHPFVLDTDSRFCSNEEDTAAVKRDSISARADAECPFYTNDAEGRTEANMNEFYTQKVTTSSIPHMLALGTTLGNAVPGICFHWVYEEQPAGQRTPEYVQFYLEFFAPFPDTVVFGTEFVIRSKKFKMDYKAGSTLTRFPPPAKDCHSEVDPHGIFKPIPFPGSAWEILHKYNIYPDKNNYRRCLQDSLVHHTCLTQFPIDEVIPPISPIVVIPGIIGPDHTIFNHRYNNTRAIYNGCVASKLCFAPLPGDNVRKSDCLLEMNCEFVWAIGKQPINPVDETLPDPDENDEIVLEVYATTIGWAAIGLSIDRNMGEDIVFECVKELDNTVSSHYSWNIILPRTQASRPHDNRRFAPNTLDHIARLVHYRRDNDSVHCIFYIKNSFQVRSLQTGTLFNYDLKSDRFCVLSAYGEKFKKPRSAGIDSHTQGQRKGFATCSEKTDLSIRIMPTRTEVELLQDHGAVMTVAFIGFLSSGVFATRYLKLSLTKMFLNYPLWIWIHAVFCSISSVLILLGYILNYTGVSGWKSKLASPFHQWMGHLSVIFVLINIPVGFHIRRRTSIETNPDNLKHSIFYVIHGAGGHFALVAGLFLIYLSVHVEYSFVPCETEYVAGGYVLFYFLVHIAMSFNRSWLNKLCADKNENMLDDKPKKKVTLTPFLLLTQNAPLGSSWYEEYSKATTVRMVIQIVFFVISVGFTVGIVYLIVTSDHSCALDKAVVII